LENDIQKLRNRGLSVVAQFEKLHHRQCQRLAIRLRIAGLQADVHREAMNLELAPQVPDC